MRRFGTSVLRRPAISADTTKPLLTLCERGETSKPRRPWRHSIGDAKPALNERPESALEFGTPEARRIGDERPASHAADDHPRTRAREAGRSSGEMPGRRLSTDDHAPGTLIADSAPLQSGGARAALAQ